jgi:hypothetical protein
MGESVAWFGFFFGGWGTSFSAYVVVQSIAMWTLKRSFWFAALIPLVAMLVVALATAQAYRHESNMWPMLMILVSPIAVLVVAAIEITGLRVQAHPRQRQLTLLTLAVVAAVLAFQVYVFDLAA